MTNYLDGSCCEPDSGQCCGPGSWCCKRGVTVPAGKGSKQAWIAHQVYTMRSTVGDWYYNEGGRDD